jgi:ADP-ribose pyrophosphatase YjhB (NUDIX family)
MKVYSDPGRDPRCHAISHAFVVKDYSGTLKAGDDAADVKIFYDKPEKLAFDHSKMWDDYMKFRKFNDG